MAWLLNAYSLHPGHSLLCGGSLFLNNIRPNNVTLPSLSKRMQYWKFVIVQLNKYTSLYQKKKKELKLKGVLQIIKCIQPVSQRQLQHTGILK